MAKLKTGDVIEIRKASGLIYLHFLDRDPNLSDAVMVSPNLFDRRPAMGPSLFENGYIIFYPVSHVVRAGKGQVVGRLPSAGLPVCYRRPRTFDKNGRIASWLISTPKGESVTETLTQQQRHYAERSIWSDALLEERVSEGWNPDCGEGVDDSASDETDGSSLDAADICKLAQHYFYFATALQASRAEGQLRKMGLIAISRPSADQSKVLVIGTGPLASTAKEQLDLRASMESLADSYEGEYDGWETTV